MNKAPWMVLALLAAAGMATQAPAQGGKRARNKADAWIGRDASELLLQLRVDGGRVDIEEDDATGETRYTWRTWNPAWVETVTTGGDLSFGGPGAGGGTMVGMAPGAGPNAPGTPVFQSPTHTYQVQHAATHRCDVTFFADADGIVARWEFTGSNCSNDIRAPKR
jgi:hypothetical protein